MLTLPFFITISLLYIALLFGGSVRTAKVVERVTIDLVARQASGSHLMREKRD